MNSADNKPFSYVRRLREIRDENNKKMEGMSYRELMDWLNSKEYSDPTLRRWAAKCRQAEAALDKSPK